MGTYSSHTTIPLENASNKNFICSCGDFNKSAIGNVNVCDYATLQLQFIPPVVTKNTNSVTLTPGYIRCYINGGHAYVNGDLSMPQLREHKYALPTTVYYN